MKTAWDNGINFFDTAEIYGKIINIQASERQKDKWEKHSKLSISEETNL